MELYVVVLVWLDYEVQLYAFEDRETALGAAREVSNDPQFKGYLHSVEVDRISASRPGVKWPFRGFSTHNNN